MSPRRWSALVVLTLVLLLGSGGLLAGLVGGSDDDADRSPGTSTPEPEGDLAPDWSADVAAVGPEPVLRRSGDLVVLVGPTSVVGLDRATGDQRWTAVLNRRCAVSEPSSEGLMAIVTGAVCTKVVVLDLATGARAWSASLRVRVDDVMVAAMSEQTLTVVGDCGGFDRFRLSDGSRLPTILAVPQARCTDGQADTDGRTVVLRRDGQSGGRLVAVEADTGRVVLDRPVTGYGGGLDLVSSDPLVITTDDGEGVATRSYDAGRPGPVLVRGSFGISVVDEVDGIVLGLTQADPGREVVRAYDLQAGRQDWAHEVGLMTSVLGSDEAGLVVATPIEDVYATPRLAAVSRLDRRDGHREDLGTIELALGNVTASARWVEGDLLGVLDQVGRLTSFTLPASGSAVPSEEGSDPAAVTPDDVLDACGSIRPGSLRALGIRAAAPAPYDCTWHEYQGDDERRLEVKVYAGRESPYGTAQEDLAQWVDSERRNFADAVFAPTFVTSPSATAVPDWGDGAWVSQAFSPTGTDSFTAVVVRSGNVAVMAQAHTEAPLEAGGRVAGYQLQRAVVAVVGDILRSFAQDAPPTPGGSSGPVGAVPDVCTALADVVGGITGGVAPTVGGELRDPERRVGGCAWGDDLVVTAYAVPASAIDDTSGVDLASSALGDACSIARPVRGVAEQACRYEYASDDRDYRSTTITARAGNLLVEVDYGRDGSPTREEVDETAQEVARAALSRLR